VILALGKKTKWASFIAKEFDASIEIYQLEGATVDEAVKTITSNFDKEGVKYSVKVTDKSGNFSDKVIDYATSIDADMIMIMTKMDSSWTNFLLGSYDEEIIFNTSQIPTMCINPRKFNWKKIVDY
jgi:nucleotide-binding universal stress UspA family protein